MNTEFIQNYFG